MTWNDISPRLGLNYDLFGDGRTVVAHVVFDYFGQMAPGQLSADLVAIGAVQVRYPWNDANGDKFVQPHEAELRGRSGRERDARPGQPDELPLAGPVDPDVKNDRTREFIVGFEHD